MSIVVSLFAGWLLLIGITFAIQNYAGAASASVPAAQVFIQALGDTGAKLLLLVVIGAQLFCGMSSVTANSRMIYAFSRDGALPGSTFWHKVNPKTRTPTNAIWLAAGGAFILGLPYLWNNTAYVAVTSIAVIGLYVAYVMPTFLRLRLGSRLRLGGVHLRAVHAANRVADQPHELQLHGGRRRRGARLRRDLVARIRAQVVHRAEGPGHA
jgi:amino acid transporter